MPLAATQSSSVDAVQPFSTDEEPWISNPVKWSDSFALGIPLIDSQHRNLLALLEQVRLMVVENKPPSALQKAMNGLLAYSIEHFETEELVMRLVGFPGLDAHRGLHAQFKSQTESFAEQLEANGLDPTELLRSVKQWLLAHVLQEDPLFAEYARKASVDLSWMALPADLVALSKQQGGKEPESSSSYRFELAVGLAAAAPLVAFAALLLIGLTLNFSSGGHVVAGVAGAGLAAQL
eukprot:RCo040612